jgi:endonuclease/exonuclease/phosphatase (EEP) superfamily protein YafD
VETLLVVIGLSMVAATLLPLSRGDAWWIRIFDFPRIQIGFLLAATLAAHLVWRGGGGLWSNLFDAALLACLAYQCYSMFPYTRLARRQVEQSRLAEPEARVSLLFANVLMTNRESGRLRETIRRADPDIILAVEADEWWRGQLAGFEETHPHTVLRPQDNTYGMLLYSRLELLGPEVRFLVQDDIPSMHARALMPSGHEFELHCLHPRPPFPTEDERSTERDAELLLVGKSIKGTQTPVVVFGDLNDVAWSRTNHLFQKISGLLDPRVGRGFYNTFHANYPFVRLPLDHFFHSPHFRLLDFRRLPAFGSDHFPVYISLSYEPDAVRQQPEKHADAGERQEAEEKIEKAT